ncbi:MAG: virulence factor family protein [Nitrospirae bacterium]|nr:virulence factor family protein [Nitrospirota bacterium]
MNCSCSLYSPLLKRSLFTLAVILFAINYSYAAETTLEYGIFGKVTLYQQSVHPSQVVIFVSGDGGWNLGVVDMARELATLDALVIGVDITHYLKELSGNQDKCSYPAGDFELLSKFVQKKLDFPRYIPPILVGYSSGATLVYATIVQSPPGTFRGAISLGFCPDLPLNKPFCRGSGLEWTTGPHGKGFSFLPAKNLSIPWIAFQGDIDQVCNAMDVEAYVKKVDRGEMVLLPRVGHGFSVTGHWMPQFRKAFRSLVEKQDQQKYAEVEDLKDLPLVEVRARQNNRKTMAVIISGDGGWANIDREIGDILSNSDIDVVGFNSLQYFWSRRTPDTAADDLNRVLNHYLTAWNKENAVLIGYSLGADVLPFMINRLPAEILGHVPLAVLVGPGHEVDFEFHVTDWLGRSSRKTAAPVLPEVEKIKVKKILCFYGEEENDSLCRVLKMDKADIIPLKGGHHYGGDYKKLGDTILREIR